MTAKDEALRAIEHVESMLSAARDAGPHLGPLQTKLALATLEHAKEQIGLIQELKRSRRPKPAVKESV